MFDPIQQRILGVLVEKERTVPDSYPLTENTLLLGCNQKSNRDPEMSLSLPEIQAALEVLQRGGWVTRLQELWGRRTVRWRHQLESQLGTDAAETAVLTELLLRGPQSPGALKPRVPRLGFTGSPEEILAVLERLRARDTPLVEPLPREPRERDARWSHRLGPRPSPSMESTEPPVQPTLAPPPPAADEPSLADRVLSLERALAELHERVQQIEARAH